MQRNADIGGFLSQTFEIVRDSSAAAALFVFVTAALGIASDWISADPSNFFELDAPVMAIGVVFAVLISVAVMVVA